MDAEGEPMTQDEIASQLKSFAGVDDFAYQSTELTDRWTAANVGIEAVEPILRFMEDHPSIDYGMPGALVHFVETFYKEGYEEKLLESISRKPTPHTIWMLNRVINGAKDPPVRRQLVEAMVRAKSSPLADPDTIAQINSFLE